MPHACRLASALPQQYLLAHFYSVYRQEASTWALQKIVSNGMLMMLVLIPDTRMLSQIKRVGKANWSQLSGHASTITCAAYFK